MDVLNTKSQLELSRNVHDLGSINKMRDAIASGDDKVLEEAAQQFEAIFVQMMLKSMRKAQDVLADEDSPFNSEHMKFYRDMHDQQLAADLSSGDGLGLAEIIIQQLGQKDENYTPASVLRGDGNIASLNQQRREHTLQAQAAVIDSQSHQALPAYKDALFSSPDAFVEALRPHAERVAAELGLDARAIISQAAVETGWGKYVIHDGQGKPTHNLFGIKAGNNWTGKSAAVDTLEFVDGVASKQKAAFRAYDSLSDAVEDYGRFIAEQPRYQQALNNGQDAKGYAEALQQAGYATDPGYADKIMSVYHSDRLQTLLPQADD
ncbi:flagellar assembly peptidoglycan hydrolase FlgJ [Alteromonas sp. CYL-A6]|uniref:flagellar assembly peptidoglycan hydrolase FlgJ n=1 Tax=Alteromonas nitratireducens TaxID=3390813 RepID=UPI0034A7BCF0